MANGPIDPVGALFDLREDLGALDKQVAKERHRFNNFEQGYLGEWGRISRLERRVEKLEALMFRVMGGAAALGSLLTLAVTLAALAWRAGIFGGGK